MARVAFAIALLCLLPWPVAAQAASEPPPPYLIEYSSVAMTRNASLVETGLRLAERGSDWLLDRWTGDLFTRRSTTGVLSRFGWWAVLGFVDACASATVHEYGHVARADEIGWSGTVHIHCLGTSFFRASGDTPLTTATTMSMFGGGMEGEQVLADRVEDRVYASGAATINDLTMLFVSRLGPTFYTFDSLSEDRLSSPERFFTGENGRPSGDPSHYALAVAVSRTSSPAFSDVQASGRDIRRRSLINLVDYSTILMGIGIGRDYLWRGERRSPVRWLTLGPVALAPGLAYRLSPVGPEHVVRSRYKVGRSIGEGYVRWTEALAPGSSRLVGAGGDVRRPPLRGFTPVIGFDVWRNPEGTTSVRGEFGGTYSRKPSDPFVFSFAVGGKGRGYILGHPLDSGAYFAVGAGVRF